MEPSEVTVGENTFYIHPYAAFRAARISTSLIALIGPVIAGVFGMLDKDSEDKQSGAEALMKACASLSGEKVEKLLSDLLLSSNVAVAFAPDRIEWLRKDTCDMLFTRKILDMYKLAYEVIKVNFGDFFELFSSRSGNAEQLLEKMAAMK